MSDAKGPYKVKNNGFWWHVDGLGEEDRLRLNEWAYKHGAEWWADRLNDAYAAGRASRDGLKEELERLLDCVGEQDYKIIEEVIEADEETK